METSDELSLTNARRMTTNTITNSSFVAGLCPQYWAYTPVSVMDVLNMKLKDGINWLELSLSNTELSTPVSKCLLVGQIVYKAEKRDGSVVYILDDGTGVIDCVRWSNSNNNNGDDPYQLPSLTDTLADQDQYGDFPVGVTVRVFGKIECLAFASNAAVADGGRTSYEKNKNHGNKFIIREIQITIIERVEECLVSEANHWIDSHRLAPVNLNSCLDTLGPQIRSQIEKKNDFPALDNTLSSWRIFGKNCHCILSYMEALLYCHCHCKPENLDPFYRFRDALLDSLLSMQSRTTKGLEFNYREIRSDHHLQTVALNEIIVEKRIAKKALIEKLFLKTFRALRCDGIIYLLNSNTDDYLLITKNHVLEPFIMSEIENEMKPLILTRTFVSYKRAPRFISRVHNERLLYIKQMLYQQSLYNNSFLSKK